MIPLIQMEHERVRTILQNNFSYRLACEGSVETGEVVYKLLNGSEEIGRLVVQYCENNNQAYGEVVSASGLLAKRVKSIAALQLRIINLEPK